MLYWEWNVNGIQLKQLETGTGMLVWIDSSNLRLREGISDMECATMLFRVIRLPYKSPLEVKKSFNLQPKLKVGDVFSNIPNLEKLVNAKIISMELQSEFPLPLEGDQWSNNLVGFISDKGICLIIVRWIRPFQLVIIPPERIWGSGRWLSGRVLQNDGKTLVLPHGVTEIPKEWKSILDHNKEREQYRLQLEEYNKLEEAKWRVWKDKDGKPLNNGEKMRLEYWYKPNYRPMGFPDDLSYKDGVVNLKTRVLKGNYIVDQSVKTFSLSQFNKEDQKQIMSVPPMEIQESNTTGTFHAVDAQGNIIPKKPKPVEPEPDDIE
jgi:hypothetical protein